MSLSPLDLEAEILYILDWIYSYSLVLFVLELDLSLVFSCQVDSILIRWKWLFSVHFQVSWNSRSDLTKLETSLEIGSRGVFTWENCLKYRKFIKSWTIFANFEKTFERSYGVHRVIVGDLELIISIFIKILGSPDSATQRLFEIFGHLSNLYKSWWIWKRPLRDLRKSIVS